MLSYASTVADTLRFVADPEGEAFLSLIYKSDESVRAALSVIGGEKGLSSVELDKLISSGFVPASVGPYVLKAMTAAVSCAGIQSYLINR